MDNLVILINALSPSEKQHFKKRNKSNADFVILFDYINKNKSFSTSKALTYLSKKQKGKKVINSSYLSVAKKYLKNRILESLRAQYIHKKKNYELLSGAMNTDIFIEKGLYSLARIEIDSFSEKNFDSSFLTERLLLLKRKGFLFYYENYANSSLAEIDSMYNARLEMVNQLLIETKLQRYVSLITFQYLNGLTDPKLLKSFMNEPFMKNESLLKDFATKFLFYWVHAQIEEFNNNTDSAVSFYTKSIQIWLNNPKYINAHPRLFLEGCYHYFKFFIRQKETISYSLDDIDFNSLLLNINIESLSGFEQERYNVIFLLFQMVSLRKQNKWDEIINLSSPVIGDKNQIETTFTYECVIFCYYVSLAQFNKGNFDKSENILFNLLNPLDKRLASNPVYITVFLLLHIIILLEKGNDKHLRHLLPKYKHYLKQEKKLTDFEIHFFTMASQLTSSRFKSTPELVYKRFHKRLIESQKTDLRGIKIEYDYFVSWVKIKELL
jgi:hypothetical protein